MATVDPTINDTMTNIQLRQIRQKLEEEKRLRSRLSSSHSLNEPGVKLQQAVLKRQELLDKLREEQKLQEDLIRPASHTVRRTPRLPSARRSESQPLPRHAYDTTTPRQVVEHQFRPVRLEPLEQAPKPPSVIQPAMQTPYLVSVPTQPPNTKAEMMEMMMLQNAQMHQMIMNQMMIQAMPKPPSDGGSKRVIEADDVIIKRRSSPVVYYETPQRIQPQQQPVYTLPPVVGALPAYPHYPSPRYYPTELEPLRYPRAKKKSKPKPAPVPQPKKKISGKLPFPGPRPLRRFRQAAYAVFFQKVLEKILRKKYGRSVAPGIVKETDQDFLFGIKLKEVVAALHAIYLSPSSKIGRLLREFSEDGARDLVAGVNSEKTSERTKAIESLDYIIENVVYEMTDIMPAEGVLGTHRKAHVVDMCRDGKLYPRGYLWQIEKNILPLDKEDRTRNVGDFESYLLILGIFLARGVATTLLMKPVQYELLADVPGPVGSRNLKLLATLFIYLYRKIILPAAQLENSVPLEISANLYTDNEMKSVFNSCKGSINYAEKLIQRWGKEYITRIRKVIATEG